MHWVQVSFCKLILVSSLQSSSGIACFIDMLKGLVRHRPKVNQPGNKLPRLKQGDCTDHVHHSDFLPWFCFCSVLAGFPTLKTIQKLQVELKSVGVNVLGNPSKKESCILVLPDVRQELGDINAERVKFMVLERVYVKWPYLQEAQVSDCY